jgi:TubC N-terminal docking domain
MTARALLDDLRRQRARVTVTPAGRLRIEAPRGVVTAAVKAVLAEHKPALLALLASCRSCGNILAWVEDWPCEGESRWLCPTCAAWPAPTLAAVFAQLTAEERQRLDAEAAAGGRLAQVVTDAVLCAPEPCAWRLYSRRLDRELWLARDAKAAAALDADGARAGLPVVLADDLERLRDFDDQHLRELLEVLSKFPGARLAQLDVRDDPSLKI